MSAGQRLKNERGMAMLEAVPLLVIFVVLFSFGMGFFGVIHTATLHSIAARTYAFETFRGRTNLGYFREEGSGTNMAVTFHNGPTGWRYHAVLNESEVDKMNPKFWPSQRPIALGRTTAAVEARQDVHNQEIYDIRQRNEKTGVNPVWIMVGYGICLNAKCGN